MTGDFETHPVGTAERMHQMGVVGVRAAEIIEGIAQDLKDSETIDGEWPDEDTYNAHKEYDELITIAGHLRALCGPTPKAVGRG
jgi:hypothetical protein